MKPQAELLVDARCATGESPVWSVAEQALYWVDIPAGRLCRWSQAGVTQWQAPEMLACIAFFATGEGRWLAGMECGLFAVTVPQAGSVLQCQQLTSVAHASAGMRFNDGRCDRQGRFWAGSMLMDMQAARASGVLYRFAQDGLVPQVTDLIVPNGLAFSPDGCRMYLSDSHPTRQLIWQFDYDPATGTPSQRRVFVDMNAFPGRPDGAAVDTDGCYWICGNDAGLVHRFTPSGVLDYSLQLPVRKPAMCAFGGADLRTLFVTSIRPAGDMSDQPLAGGVFAFRVATQGMAEPAFTAAAGVGP